MGQLFLVYLGLGCWLVDPGLGGHGGWVWSVSESLGVGVVGGGEGVLAVLVDGVGGAEVDRCGCVPGDPGVSVDVVVLLEKSGAELSGVGQGHEIVGELG
jgi:hypothetical protein